MILAAGFIAALASPTTLPTVESAGPAAEWNEKFRGTEGWIGGDGAYSVPLSNEKALWLFSDTLVGSIDHGKRTDLKLVNNSIGIQSGRGDKAKLTFAIRRIGGQSRAMLAPPDGKGWFWLHAGIAINDRLFVFLPRIEPNGKDGAFGFKQVEQWLATISNPAAEPSEWKTAYAKLPFVEFAAARTVSFGAALLRVGESIYVYGYEEKPGKPFPIRRLLVARAPAGKLADFGSWRFFEGSGWKANVNDTSPMASGLATEFSVGFVSGIGKYALVYTENGIGDRIVGRFAESPVGPWSEPLLLYRCPEMRRSKKVFSYAAKAHSHIGGDNELVLTYCVNAFDLGTVIGDAALYWPNFVKVRLK
jgi:hypothetical protein